MEQKYTVAAHGDLLEKEGAAFIRNKVPNYELVWQTFIGNTGNATRAPLPGYPDERKRQSFAEHSYSTFEACFMIQYLLDSGVFIAQITSLDDYVRLNQSFISFFTYLGRIHDLVLKAAGDLSMNDRSFEQKLNEFYSARNIVLHGKKVPIMLDGDGFLIMPSLQTPHTKGKAWDDKNSIWQETSEMETDFVIDTCETYFNDLISLINEEYGRFYGVIAGELSRIPTQLVFDRSNEGLFSRSLSNQVPPASGSTSVGMNVYNIKENFVPGKR